MTGVQTCALPISAAGVPAEEIGTVGGDRLVARGAFDLALDAAEQVWRDAIPTALGVGV